MTSNLLAMASNLEKGEKKKQLKLRKQAPLFRPLFGLHPFGAASAVAVAGSAGGFRPRWGGGTTGGVSDPLMAPGRSTRFDAADRFAVRRGPGHSEDGAALETN